ncbi:RNA polymerase sigma factor [Thalassobacillus hwangdonensis]|uniref:RNA polymerase sigma factor n=1 Tax=Thalassobacillus hwangdonensis TaxID=546108 RepID=A0ABW3L2T0_9BACI
MDVLAKLEQQDERTMKEVMDQYGSYLKRSSYLMVKDEQLAEEIVQDSFIKAFRNIHQLKEPEKLKSWLTTITYNLCRSHLRKKRFKLFSISDHDHHLEDEREEQPESYIVRISQNQQLAKAVLQLKDTYREVIVLFHYDEYSIEEIEAITGMKQPTIKTRLRRGRNHLKEILEKGGLGDE